MSRFQPLIESLEQECELIDDLLKVQTNLLWDKHNRLATMHYPDIDSQLADFRQMGDLAKDIQDYRRELIDKRQEIRRLERKD